MLYHHGFREAFFRISVENAVIIQLYQVEMNEMGIKLSLFQEKCTGEWPSHKHLVSQPLDF